MSDNNNTDESLWDAEVKYFEKLKAYKAGLKQVDNKVIKQLGIKFHDNLKLVCDMLILPRKLLALEYHRRSLVPYEVKASIIAQLDMDINDDNYREHYEKILNELIQSKYSKSKVVEDTMEYSKQAFINLLADKKVGLRQTYEAILYSGAVWIWCGFEVLIKELWVYALNDCGRYLIKNVIKKLPAQVGMEDDRIRGKNISLDYLAQYDYDLSKKMGSALLHKFDFTSSRGIKDAYSRAFPKSTDIKDAIDDKKIAWLEATRNVIVHNAGIIDREFCDKTNTNITEVGKRLRLNSRKVSEYGNSAMDIGLRVMISVSSNVSYAKSLERK